MTYRTAIVGLSWIGADPAGAPSDPVLGTATPYSHASAMAPIPQIEVVGGCDISEGARTRFTETWGGRWPGAKTYGDYRQMLAETKPDIVSVVTPDHLHKDVVLAAIEHGAKGIFCDKPLSVSLAEADEMVKAVREADVVMAVNYGRRWYPQYAEARRIVRSGEIGRLSQIVTVTGGPRAMLWRNHTHVIDLMNFLADGEPDWVWAELEHGYADYGTVYKGDGGSNPDTEPGANFYIAYKNGVRAYVSGFKDTPPGEPSVTLAGPGGKVVIDMLGIRLITFEAADVRVRPAATKIEIIEPKFTVTGMQAAVLDLIRVMEHGGETQSPPEVARRTVAITDAILLSQARGNVPVHLSELDPA
jgi:predicted dehydrogenase